MYRYMSTFFPGPRHELPDDGIPREEMPSSHIAINTLEKMRGNVALHVGFLCLNEDYSMSNVELVVENGNSQKHIDIEKGGPNGDCHRLK